MMLLTIIVKANFHVLSQIPADVTLLLHSFTAHWLPWEQEIVLIGGGGNCFSFGTHLNHTPVVTSLASIVAL